MKKLIYTMVLTDKDNHTFATTSTLFFTIQLIIAVIYTFKTSGSFINIKLISILLVINLLLSFLEVFAIRFMMIHDFDNNAEPVEFKVDSYSLSKASGKEFYTIRTNKGVKVIDKDRVDVVHMEVFTDDQNKIGTTEVKYAELKVPENLPKYKFDLFTDMLKHVKNPSMLMTFKYVKNEAKD